MISQKRTKNISQKKIYKKIVVYSFFKCLKFMKILLNKCVNLNNSN